MPTPVRLDTLPQRLAGIRALPATIPTHSGPGFRQILNAQTSQVQAANVMSVQTPESARSLFKVPSVWGENEYFGTGVRLRGGGIIAPEPAGTAGCTGGVCNHTHTPAVAAGKRVGAPAELKAYGNGKIPTAALAPIGIGEHRLWAPAARAFKDMVAAAAAEGIDISKVNSSYRDMAGQHRMVKKYGLYSQGGRAAQPGTSNHGWGLSIDLSLGGDAQTWMRTNAARFGFEEDVPREPWHWTFTAETYG